MPPKRKAAKKDADDDLTAAPKTSKGRTKAAKKSTAADDDDEDDAAPPPVPSSSTSTDDPSSSKTIVVKGQAAVDSLCPQASKYRVYADSTGPWDATLNQTNISANNNKFYIIQLLESETGGGYSVWTRWGRVGAPGQNMFLPGGDLATAKRSFESKFKDKTSNHWSNKDTFEKVSGKYDLVKIDYSTNASETEEHEKALADASKNKAPPKPKEESKLAKPVQNLIELIFDVKKMTDSVVEMKYDVKKMPLGKLTSEQIKAGYQALKDLEDLIQKGSVNNALYDEYSSAFYTRIPHVFGMSRPPLIKTLDMVKEKLKLLEALEDIKIAISMIKEESSSVNQIDLNYKQLNCGLTSISRGSEKFDLVEKFMKNSHGTTHSTYHLELLDLFEVEKATGFKAGENTMLLWHGSRLTNWAGILSQGLRIAPPEAPCTGYMFGKGVYFADMVSKSANYCFTSRDKNIGILLLCEVVLGKQNKLLDADNRLHEHLPKGTQSTMGLGRVMPDPKQNIVVDGVTIPIGTQVNTGINNPGGFTLQYNEFIVYDTTQIRFRYLLKCKFNYK